MFHHGELMKMNLLAQSQENKKFKKSTKEFRMQNQFAALELDQQVLNLLAISKKLSQIKRLLFAAEDKLSLHHILEPMMLL